MKLVLGPAVCLAIAGFLPHLQAQPASQSAAPKRFTSLAEVERWAQEQRLAAIESYAPDAKAERADALRQAAELAGDLGKWDRARQHAEAYLKEFPTGEATKPMQLTVLKGLTADPTRLEDARKECVRLMDAYKDDVQFGVTAGLMFSELMVDAGRVDDARNALIDLMKRFAETEGLSEFLQPRLADLDDLGKEPKGIDVKTLDDKPFKLADWKGKVVLIDFWATWCQPCVAELPNVLETHKKFHDQGFEVIGISLDQDEAALRAFVKEREIPWPTHLDSKGELAQAYRVTGIPRTYLLDREGKVHRIGVRGAELARTVERLVTASKAAASRPADPPAKR